MEKAIYKNKTASMVLQFGHQILAGKNPRLFEGSDQIIEILFILKMLLMPI